MARSWCFLGCVVVSAWALGGCDEAPRSSRCSSICAKRELCDSNTDEAGCVDDCQARNYLSDDYIAYWAQCVAPDSVSCNLAMDDAAVDDCVTDKLRAQPPSDLVDQVCRALSSKLAACDDVDAPETERACQRGDSLKLSDDYLEKSRECVDALCEDVEGCFADLADGYNTNLSIVPSVASQPTDTKTGDVASGLADQVEGQARDAGQDLLGDYDASVPLWGGDAGVSL